MIKVAVKINGKEYSLVGREDEQYLKDVAEYVNSRIAEVKAKNPLLSLVDSSVLASVNIADELYKVDIEAARLAKEKGQLIKENQELNKKVRELSDSIEGGKKGTQISIDELKINNDVLKEQIEALTKENADLYRAVEKGNRINTLIVDENKKLKEDILKEKQSRITIEEELLSVKDKNNEFKKQIASIRTDDNGSSKELKTAKYKVLDLEKKLLDAQFEIAKLKKNANPLMK